MWEWRVFWSLPVNCSDLDVWRAMEDSGRRSDVYLVATAEVGVKLRGEQDLEVKVMIEKDAKSGAEKWTKLNGGYVGKSSNLQKQVVTVLEKLQAKYSQQLDAARAALAKQLTQIKIDKDVRKRGVISAVVEQTDLMLLEGQRWRTVCVEASDLKAVVKMLDKPANQDGLGRGTLREVLCKLAGLSMGYPEFVLQQSEQHTTQ